MSSPKETISVLALNHLENAIYKYNYSLTYNKKLGRTPTEFISTQGSKYLGDNYYTH